MKRILLAPLLPLVATGLIACSPKPPPAQPTRAVRTAVVASTAGGSHEYAAEVRARTESRLGFRVGGKLVSRSADLGDAVRAGQALAQLDPRDLQLGQQAAQAALGAAKANFEFSQTEFKRYQELREQGFISRLELERRATALVAAQAQYEQAQVQAGMQGNQARYATLSADASGVITGVDAEPGAVVAAGAPVLRLAHDGPRDAVFNVPEDRVAQMRSLLGVANALRVTLWNDRAAPIVATVREVAAAADPTTRTFVVKADIGRAAVRLGQTAAVRVESPHVVGQVKLPLPAVFELRGVPTVWVLDRASMTVRPQAVRLAGAEGNDVVIAGGVSLGETVVVAGVHVLSAGQKVRLYAERGAQAGHTAPLGGSVATR